MTPIKKRHTNWIEAYPIRQRIKKTRFGSQIPTCRPLTRSRGIFQTKKIPDQKKTRTCPKDLRHWSSHLFTPRVSLPDVSRSLSVDIGIGFVKSLKKRSVYYTVTNRSLPCYRKWIIKTRLACHSGIGSVCPCYRTIFPTEEWNTPPPAPTPPGGKSERRDGTEGGRCFGPDRPVFYYYYIALLLLLYRSTIMYPTRAR
jgi:hypothetical protein